MTWRVGLRPAATLLALVAMLIGASLTGALGRAEALDRPAIGAGSLSIRIVEFDPSSSLLDLIHLEEALSELLGVSVDVISAAALLERDIEIRRDAVAL